MDLPYIDRNIAKARVGTMANVTAACDGGHMRNVHREQGGKTNSPPGHGKHREKKEPRRGRKSTSASVVKKRLAALC
jgi:hypothetical protein